MTLGEIYERHADFVWRCLRRHGVPDGDAPDAVQDVFLTVHRTLAGFEGRSSVRTWLFAICRSVARDRRNRASRRHEVASLDAVGPEVDTRADAAARFEHNSRLSLLGRILAAMEPEQRELLVLYEIEDMTGEEIAQALSLPLGTVYSRLQVARAAFRGEVARSTAAAGEDDSDGNGSDDKPRKASAGARS
jgi:RNA polymerase sigma-70 factor (ECF subfamily)